MEEYTCYIVETKKYFLENTHCKPLKNPRVTYLYHAQKESGKGCPDCCGMGEG